MNPTTAVIVPLWLMFPGARCEARQHPCPLPQCSKNPGRWPPNSELGQELGAATCTTSTPNSTFCRMTINEYIALDCRRKSAHSLSLACHVDNYIVHTSNSGPMHTCTPRLGYILYCRIKHKLFGESRYCALHCSSALSMFNAAHIRNW